MKPRRFCWCQVIRHHCPLNRDMREEKLKIDTNVPKTLGFKKIQKVMSYYFYFRNSHLANHCNSPSQKCNLKPMKCNSP